MQHSRELSGVNRRKASMEEKEREVGETGRKAGSASPYLPSTHFFLLNINKGACPDSVRRMARLAYHKASLCPKLISLCVPSYHEYS